MIGFKVAILHAIAGILVPLFVLGIMTRFLGKNMSFREGLDVPMPVARRNEQAIFQTQSRREDSIEIMKSVQAKYDAGQDSYDAIGLPRPD